MRGFVSSFGYSTYSADRLPGISMTICLDDGTKIEKNNISDEAKAKLRSLLEDIANAEITNKFVGEAIVVGNALPAPDAEFREVKDEEIPF